MQFYEIDWFTRINFSFTWNSIFISFLNILEGNKFCYISRTDIEQSVNIRTKLLILLKFLVPITITFPVLRHFDWKIALLLWLVETFNWLWLNVIHALWKYHSQISINYFESIDVMKQKLFTDMIHNGVHFMLSRVFI